MKYSDLQPLGKGDCTKMDELLEKFQKAFDPPPPSFSENHNTIFFGKGDKKFLCKGIKSAM